MIPGTGVLNVTLRKGSVMPAAAEAVSSAARALVARTIIAQASGRGNVRHGNQSKRFETFAASPEGINSLSSVTGAEGRGEEPHLIGCTSPHSFHGRRGRERFVVVAATCVRSS